MCSESRRWLMYIGMYGCMERAGRHTLRINAPDIGVPDHTRYSICWWQPPVVRRFHHKSPDNSPLRCHMQLYTVLCVNHCADSRRIEKETPRFAAHSIYSQTTAPETSRSADPAQPKQLTVNVFSEKSSNRKRFWSDSWDERPSGRLCSGTRRWGSMRACRRGVCGCTRQGAWMHETQTGTYSQRCG